jgi:uncharacterized protein (TIGR02145 family)
MKSRIMMIAVAVSFVLVVLAGCGGDDNPTGNGGDGDYPSSCNITDYKTVEINGQIWMAENLNCKTADSWCYGEGGTVYDSPNNITLSSAEIRENCKTYGRLYTWNAALTACPAGWHLPTRGEWFALVTIASNASNGLVSNDSTWGTGQTHLRSENWDNGLNSTGFSALPGGLRYRSGQFEHRGGDGYPSAYWWTATEGSDTSAFYYNIKYSSSMIFGGDFYKDMGYSVRCVQN